MKLTPRELELLNLIREAPASAPEELARRLGTSRAAVNVHVSSLIRKGALLGRGYLLPTKSRRHVTVVGGANVDFKSRTLAPALPATSNPGTTRQAVGGVGRNVTENLARLGVAVNLISAVGRDALGDFLLSETEKTGVDVRGVLRSVTHPTGTYTAILDATGELLVAVAAMQVMDELTPAALQERRAALSGAQWVITDGNLTPATLTHVLKLAAQVNVKTVFEPVSVPKVAHLFSALDAGFAPDVITPNLAELSALTGRDVPDTEQGIRSAALTLHARGIPLVWVRRGARGSALSGPDTLHTFPALPAQVVDVTGAGDAMLATFVAALMEEQLPEQAARLAHAAAALTIESEHTVRPDLTLQSISERLTAGGE
ncbi:carbohydrate kinase [Deinococcus fonticola]|uniref:carbohydrate kinase n=1 Tax=Deinococcus fonticola TaxID=2528713 RepID=UPI0010755EF2|nr:carbohydrate kinase [Deinococcus fonticola]